jgi:hypothetical protein
MSSCAFLDGEVSQALVGGLRIIGDQDGFLKLIGVHIMGDLATEVLSIGPVAMMCNASANLFDAGQILVPIKVVPEAALPKLRRSGYFRLAA